MPGIITLGLKTQSLAFDLFNKMSFLVQFNNFKSYERYIYHFISNWYQANEEVQS